MRTDSRLSRVLHILLHLARQPDHPMTSEQIAAMLNTNAAVIRRTMAGLRKSGYVSSEKGHGGGWSIACDFSTITLLDIYHAVGSPQLFAIGFEQHEPNCVVEQTVNHSLDDTLQQAKSLILERFKTISLANLNDDFIQRYCAAIQ